MIHKNTKMLTKKYKKAGNTIFIKVPPNTGCCNGVCDNTKLGKCCYTISICSKANYLHKPDNALHWKHSYWIPKGHLTQKYKKYEN